MRHHRPGQPETSAFARLGGGRARPPAWAWMLLGLGLGLAAGVYLIHRWVDVALALERGCPDRAGSACKAGEFGSCLNGLERYYHPPQGPGESNYLFDMWSDQKLASYARQSGLTNNHALLV